MFPVDRSMHADRLLLDAGGTADLEPLVLAVGSFEEVRGHLVSVIRLVYLHVGRVVPRGVVCILFFGRGAGHRIALGLASSPEECGRGAGNRIGLGLGLGLVLVLGRCGPSLGLDLRLGPGDGRGSDVGRRIGLSLGLGDGCRSGVVLGAQIGTAEFIELGKLKRKKTVVVGGVVVRAGHG